MGSRGGLSAWNAALGVGWIGLSLVAASAGCSALLDLDVQYKDGGASGDDSPGAVSGSSGGASGSTSDGGSGSSSGVNEPDASGESGADATMSGSPDASTGPDASPVVDASIDAGTPPHYLQGAFGRTDMMNVGAHATLVDPVTAGSTIVVGVETSSDMAVTLTDSLGGQWHLAGSLPTGDVFGNSTAVWYAIGVQGGAETVSVTFEGEVAGDFVSLFVHEYAGISGVDVVALGNGDAGSSSGAMVTTAMMTTVPNDLLFAFGDTTAAHPGTGFTARRTDDADLTEDRVVAQPSSVSATATTDGGQWAIVGVAFKPL